ncbi:TPA: TIGR00295 family protein [Candidatus Bathyarchaeota archaeon]|nr:TIGR00295 family protein [Candidatus Bathyarchaeota archaeon]
MPSSKEALKILKASGCSPGVIKHCKAVSDLAVKIARKCKRNGISVNLDLVRVGALLHDIGRSKTHSVHHPIVGAEIAQSFNLPEPIIRIIKRHLGGGLTAEEASELGWPVEDYLPETIEEKIVTYADKLIAGERTVLIQETIKKLSKRLGVQHPSIKRIMNLHKEITEVCGEPVE